MIKYLKHIFLFFLLFVININGVLAGLGFDGTGSSGGTSFSGETGGTGLIGSNYITTGFGLKYSLVNISGSLSVASSYIQLYPKNCDDFTYKTSCKELRKNENGKVIGEISGNQYYANEVKFDGYHRIVSNEDWYFSTGKIGAVGLVIDSDKIYNYLSDTANDKFYDIVSRLLNLDKEILGDEIDINGIKKIINDTSAYTSERNILKDYIVIVEPIYGIQKMTSSTTVEHRFMTLKSMGIYAGNGQLSDANYLTIEKMVKNFQTTTDHGVIQKSSGTAAGLRSATDGTGYFIAYIVDDGSTCDPNSSNACCFESNGTYHPEYTGKDKTKFKCLNYNEETHTCTGNVTSCAPAETATVCEDGSEPYSFNYMFLLADKMSSNYNNNLTNKYKGTNDKFSDLDILTKLVEETNTASPTGEEITIDDVQILDSKEIIIDDSNVKNFYTQLSNIFSYANYTTSSEYKYAIGSDKTYYIWHTKYTNSNGITTDEKNTSLYTAGRNDDLYDTIDKTIFADYTITVNNLSSGAHNFNITRNMPQLSNNIYNRPDGNTYDFTNKWYFSPAQYQIKYCISTKPVQTCPDNVSKAKCVDTDTGVKATFNESDKLNACILDESNKSSGFTIVSKNETNNYCTVACKDEYEINLPGKKYTTAGGYYVLNVSTDEKETQLGSHYPTVSITRTCITSKIDYSKFKTDAEDAKEAMQEAYNTWRDYVEFNGSEESSQPTSETVKYKINTCNNCDCCSYDSETGECNNEANTYSYFINSKVGDNYNDSSLLGGVKYNGASQGGYSDCDGDGYSKAERAAINKYNSDIWEKLIDAEKKYLEKRKAYINIIREYEKCYKWNDNPNDKSTNTNTTNDTNKDKFKSIKARSSTSSPTLEELNNKGVYKFFNYDSNDKSDSNLDKLDVNENPELYYYYGVKTDANNNATDLATDEDADSEKVNRKIEKVNEIMKSEDTLSENDLWYNKYYYSTSSYTTEDDAYANISASVSYKGVNYELTDCSRDTSGSGSLNGTQYSNCNNSGQSYGFTISNNIYIKRVEKRTWEYILPQLYTLIPSGKLTTDSSASNSLILETNASPVNINTTDGLHHYLLRFENLSDEVRDKKSNKSSDGYIENRIANSKLFNSTSLDYVCDYNVQNDAYTTPDNPGGNGGINFFYRTVDLGNINPQSRTLGYNWNNNNDNKAAAVQNRMKETNTNYQKLVGNEELTGEGKEYGKTTDKFSFTLTPAIMKEIRNYNTSTTYSDWNLTCSDYSGAEDMYDVVKNNNYNANTTYRCESKFITCLVGKDAESCDGVNLNVSVLKSSKNSYYLVELNKNRENLRTKQNNLDKLSKLAEYN